MTDVKRIARAGEIHWNSVSWALMPECQNSILIKDINAKIPIIDVSSNSILCEVARALKKQT